MLGLLLGDQSLDGSERRLNLIFSASAEDAREGEVGEENRGDGRCVDVRGFQTGRERRERRVNLTFLADVGLTGAGGDGDGEDIAALLGVSPVVGASVRRVNLIVGARG